MSEELHIMSTLEINRLEVIQKAEAGIIKQSDGARMLGISVRQFIRLIKKHRQAGAAGLVSKRRGQPSNRQHDEEFKQEVMSVMRSHYHDFGPTLAKEKLLERHQLKINKETLRQWMMEDGLWKQKRRRRVQIHQMRARRPCVGELVQIDGSLHDWFEGRAPDCCLLVLIDDASSRLLSLRFEARETALGYFKAIRGYIKQYGRPFVFYSDKHGIFRVNLPEAQSGTGETQFGRAMRELGIEVICANTPQAKGRVERANGTLQDRLVKELRLKNINDLVTANQFLPEFIEDYNKRFSVIPLNPTDVHRKEIPDDDTLNLILSFQHDRILSKNLELSYNNVIYQVKTEGSGYQLRNSKIRVSDNLEGTIKLLYKGKELAYKIFDKKNRVAAAVNGKELHEKMEQKYQADGRSKGHKPAADHPWRGYNNTQCLEKKQLPSDLEAPLTHRVHRAMRARRRGSPALWTCG